MSIELPARVNVRISSEAAGDISVTPVISQEMTPRDLVEVILEVCGKDASRVQELLRRGSVVQGASRFRWLPLDTDHQAIVALLGGFPDSDPSIAFDASRCVHARLCGPKTTVELSRELGSERKLLRRTTFWDSLMKQVTRSAPQYVEYSYRKKADVFRAAVVPAETNLLRYDGLIQQIERAQVRSIELICPRT